MLDVGCWIFSFGSWVQCANAFGEFSICFCAVERSSLTRAGKWRTLESPMGKSPRWRRKSQAPPRRVGTEDDSWQKAEAVLGAPRHRAADVVKRGRTIRIAQIERPHRRWGGRGPGVGGFEPIGCRARGRFVLSPRAQSLRGPRVDRKGQSHHSARANGLPRRKNCFAANGPTRETVSLTPGFNRVSESARAEKPF